MTTTHYMHALKYLIPIVILELVAYVAYVAYLEIFA